MKMRGAAAAPLTSGCLDGTVDVAARRMTNSITNKCFCHYTSGNKCLWPAAAQERGTALAATNLAIWPTARGGCVSVITLWSAL